MADKGYLLFQVYVYMVMPRNTMTDRDFYYFRFMSIWLCQGNTMTDRDYLLFQVYVFMVMPGEYHD